MITPRRLNPPSTLLIGPAGTGKTTVLTTLLEAGLKVRMLATEPSAPNRVLQVCKDRKIDDSKFDWKFISPSVPKWDALIDSATAVNNMTIKDLADMRTGIAKQDGLQWIEMLKCCKDFKSDRTGEVLGDVTEWGADSAFVIDGLTGLNDMSRQLTIGLKPNPNPGEWGVMQKNIEGLLKKLAADCKCFFVCIAHVERENNELTGVSQVTVSTLGAKLAPKLPPLFTTVVLARRNGAVFSWSTAAQGTDTKPGDLKFSDDLVPSFEPIVTAYRERLKAVETPANVVSLSVKP